MTVLPQFLPPIPPLPSNSTAQDIYNWAVSIPTYHWASMPNQNSSFIAGLIPVKENVAWPAWWINGNHASVLVGAVRSNNFQNINSNLESQLQNCLQHYQTPNSLRVYRGMKWSNPNEQAYKNYLALLPNHTLTETTYLATSCSAFEAHRFSSKDYSVIPSQGLYELSSHAIFLAIELTQGHPVIPIYHTREQELVLNKNLTFRVKDAHDGHHSNGKHLKVLILEPIAVGNEPEEQTDS